MRLIQLSLGSDCTKLIYERDLIAYGLNHSKRFIVHSFQQKIFILNDMIASNNNGSKTYVQKYLNLIKRQFMLASLVPAQKDFEIFNCW